MSTQFKNVEISDKPAVDRILRHSPRPSEDFNFTTMFIWQKIYDIKIMFRNDFLFVMFGKPVISFLFPIGSEVTNKETDFLFSVASEIGTPLRFVSLSPAQKEFLETEYPKKFTFAEDRDSFDYVYTAESLKTLKGKKLASKRNHINRFTENYPEWKYEIIDDTNIDEVFKMHKNWSALSSCSSSHPTEGDACAVDRALKYYKELSLTGGLIRINDGVCAFSMGDPLNDDTFLVHIEKAFPEIQGAYAIINREFVSHACNDFTYVNREDDAASPGLRKAKLSYRPAFFAEKFTACEK